MKVAFKTFGCKLNQAETNKFKIDFLKNGVSVVDLKEKPDLYIINACSVTKRAERKLRQEIYNIGRNYKGVYLIVTGCFTSNLKNNKKLKSLVDKWFPNTIKDDLVKRVLNIFHIKKKDSLLTDPPLKAEKNRAMVKIQDGCNNFCSYCIIPYLRHEIISKDPKKIVREINALVEKGFKEVNLVGVNISLYSFKNKNLLSLLKYIVKNTNISRIRISSLWPTFLNNEFINFIAKEKRICPYIHLSIQSGCDKLLKLMKREYTLKEVKKVIKQLKNNQISIGTDIIVGFPGETKSDFYQTYDFVKWAGFINLHVFKYSPRPNTKAVQLKNKVSPFNKKKRSKELRKLGQEIAENEIKKYIKNKGKANILFEERSGEYWLGKTKNYINVFLKTKKNLYNKIIKVDLIKSFKNGILVK